MFFTMHDRPSKHNRNSYDDMGSPCQIHRVSLKLSENTPLTLAEKEIDEMHFITNEHQEAGKPSACMIA
jgi:hypothetical protein